jgi:DNA-binding NarL/FixJ family response regulator
VGDDEQGRIDAARSAVARVVLVDDSDAVRTLLRALLEIDGGFEVVGEADSGNGVVELVERLRPELLVLDVAMPGRDGLQVLTELHEGGSPARTVVYTGFRSDDLDRRARELGAVDVLVKGMPPDQVVERLRQAVGD